MALISARTIITSISLFHMTMAYFMIFNPRTVDDQILVYILGRSMGLPAARGLDAPSPALAFLGVVLALFGLTDLVSLSMPEELGALYYWGPQAPIRFLFSMSLVFYSYFFGPTGPLGVYTTGTSRKPGFFGGGGGASATDGLKNRVIFTFLFIEMVGYFWLWVTLREERNSVVDKLKRRQERETY